MLKIFGLAHHEEKHETSQVTTEEMETETPVVVQSASPTISPKIRHNIAMGPARPLRLVYTDEKGKFRMDPEAVAALQLVKGPVGAVSVCGRARQGKSFILNQLLGRSSGFHVAPTQKPCTKGLWMWSAPIKRTAADGSQYNLILLDSEGIDSYDQTGQYSIQIFSLAILLSSMFVYNQMFGIDEAALDNLSLVTEMTKHIRVRASQTKTSEDELGRFSPLFVWLLRDFYFELSDDGHKITPRDYLESALQPIPGNGKAVASKNEIRNSIKALFPERDCFTLVRPLEAEQQLQHLDEIPMNKLRPEFRAGLEKLTTYILARAGPKQLGSITLTGPMFASLTQSFLDAINSGAVPTIANSWQNVEESECRRAYELALKTYTESFDQTIPPEEVLLQEAHEEALQAALNTFNLEAVGGGTSRKKYEKEVYITAKKQFESRKRKMMMDAELKCLRAVGSLEERMRNACHAPNATFESVVKVIDGLVTEYDVSAMGSAKWHKLVTFLQKSLAGPLQDLVKRENAKVTSQYSALELKIKSLEEQVAFQQKQVDAAQKDAQEWKKRYELSINDYKKASDSAAAQHAFLQKKVTTLEERSTTTASKLEVAKKEASEWQSKYQHLLDNQRKDEERIASELKNLQNRCTTAEARLAAMREQCEAAKEEAAEWRHKHDTVEADTKAAIERATVSKDRAIKQAQLREDALRADFAATLAQKDGEIKDLQAKFENGERQIATLKANLHEQESKVYSQAEELKTLKTDLRQSHAEIEARKSEAVAFSRDLEKARLDKSHAEKQMAEAQKRMEEAERHWKIAEKREKFALEAAEKARHESSAIEKEKLESQRLAVERLAAIERLQRRSESLERERDELMQTLQQVRAAEKEAFARVTALELRIEEREREMEKLLKSSNEQRMRTVETFEALLDSERAAKMEAANRAEALSVQLTNVQGELDALQTQYMSVRNHETALDTKLKSYADVSNISPSEYPARSKRVWVENTSAAVEGIEIDKASSQKSKREKVTDHSSSHEAINEGHNSNEVTRENHTPQTHEDYHKLTVAKLKQKLTEAGFGEEVTLIKSSATKRDIIDLYEKLMFPK